MSNEELVRSLDHQERVAALNRDVPALERLWSDHFVVNAPNNQVVVGRQENLDTFVRVASSTSRHSSGQLSSCESMGTLVSSWDSKPWFHAPTYRVRASSQVR